MVAHSEMDPMVRSRLKPIKEPFQTEVKKFFYNKETGAVCGRTASSWAKIIIFYVIFYIVLASLFAFLMFALYYTLDPRIPKYKLDDSLIGTNPGLGFRPMPNDSDALSSLIWYRGTKREDYEGWVDKLKNFVKEYKTPGLTPGRGQNLVSCDYGQPVPEGKVCSFDVSRNFYPCVEENNFNYHLQKPCIFLKLNKIYGWRPEYYSKEEIPEIMPDSVKNFVRGVNGHQLETIWLSCEGSTAADVENLGSIQYLPQPGFPGYFFPYMNNEGYLPPIVAIVLNNPKNGILLNIECKAWAKNIHHDRKEKLGLENEGVNLRNVGTTIFPGPNLDKSIEYINIRSII